MIRTECDAQNNNNPHRVRSTIKQYVWLLELWVVTSESTSSQQWVSHILLILQFFFSSDIRVFNSAEKLAEAMLVTSMSSFSQLWVSYFDGHMTEQHSMLQGSRNKWVTKHQALFVHEPVFPLSEGVAAAIGINNSTNATEEEYNVWLQRGEFSDEYRKPTFAFTPGAEP